MDLTQLSQQLSNASRQVEHEIAWLLACIGDGLSPELHHQPQALHNNSPIQPDQATEQAPNKPQAH